MLRLGERLRRTVAGIRVGWEGQDILVTISVGAALLEENPGGGAHGLLTAADSRLYRAKDEGRNRLIAE
jgi:GGDEF domain-containing protein